jgi:hypothetical protein
MDEDRGTEGGESRTQGIMETIKRFYLPASLSFGLALGIPTGTTAGLQGIELVGCILVTGLITLSLGWLLYDLVEGD